MRAKEDYLMGINFSRALTLKFGNSVKEYLKVDRAVISAGRVMTCVLGIVVRREREIREFVKTPFYRVLMNLTLGGRTFEGEWRAVAGSRYADSPLLYKENGFLKKETAQELISFLEQTPAEQPAQSSGESKEDGGATPVASDKDYEIVVVPKDSSNPWFVRMDVGVKEYASETGLNVYQKGTDVIDATKQAQLVQDLIAQDVDAICVVPVDPESLEPVLKQAKDAGIVVVAHEGASLTNVDYDIEAFSNAGYGQFIMDNLAEAMDKARDRGRPLVTYYFPPVSNSP